VDYLACVGYKTTLNQAKGNKKSTHDSDQIRTPCNFGASHQ
jgi:hypothetical protein